MRTKGFLLVQERVHSPHSFRGFRDPFKPIHGLPGTQRAPSVKSGLGGVTSRGSTAEAVKVSSGYCWCQVKPPRTGMPALQLPAETRVRRWVRVQFNSFGSSD